LSDSNEAYLLVKVFQSGYNFSCCGCLGEVVKEIFPLGVSPPERKHYSAVALHITPEAIQSDAFDNFYVGNIFAVETKISTGRYLILRAEKGLRGTLQDCKGGL
jgi:hypothetical protein